MNIVRRLSNNRNHFGTGNKKRYITIHQTANTSRGADALAHARYMNNGSPTTWHYTVDDKRIVQHFSHDIMCWHAGDGRGKGNTQSIGVEMCVNSDGDYKKALTNLSNLVQYIMKVENIPPSNIVPHKRWTGKNCPSQILNGYAGHDWNSFKRLLTVRDTNIVHSDDDTSRNSYLNKIADDVILGKYGNGDTRKRLLGSNYREVQKIVNKKLNRR